MSAITEKAMKEYQKGAMFDLIHSYKEQDNNTHLVVTAKKAVDTTASAELQAEQDQSQTANTQQGLDMQQSQNSAQEPQSSNLQQLAAKKTVETTNTNSQVGYGAPKAFTAPSTASQSEAATQFTAPQMTVEEPTISEPNKANIGNNSELSQSFNTNTDDDKQLTKTQTELNEQRKKELASQPAQVRKQATQHIIKTPSTSSTILSEIESATSIAELIEQVYQTQVDTHPHNFDQLPVEKINLINLEEGTDNSYLPLDQELFHTVDSVMIGEYQDILIIFRDGTPLHLAPKAWLTNADAKELLINQKYEFAYTDLDMKDFQDVLTTVSSTIINNSKYTQYMIDFLPILNS